MRDLSRGFTRFVLECFYTTAPKGSVRNDGKGISKWQSAPDIALWLKSFEQVLRPFLLRRLKSEVEKQMPKKYEHVVRCRLSKRQRFLYDDFMSKTKWVEMFSKCPLLQYRSETSEPSDASASETERVRLSCRTRSLRKQTQTWTHFSSSLGHHTYN